MPTVIALDVSLSMLRQIPGNVLPDTPEDEIPTRKRLAIEAINFFLDHISAHCKLEFVAMLSFSTLYELLIPFTRELDTIREKLTNLEDYDKTNFESFINGVNQVVINHWGSTTPVQILLITDGSVGFGTGRLSDVIKNAKPFQFPAKMNILSLSDPDDKNFTENSQLLQKLIEVTCGDGVVYFPENHLSSKGCSSAVSKLCAKDFTPFKGLLKCGQLSSKITLCPPPQPFVARSDEKRYDFSDIIEIIGFIDSNDLSSPPFISRHLLLPLKSGENCGQFPNISIKSEDNMECDYESTLPNFCVLLHGALKVESLCAICKVDTNDEWFGFIYSWADNKKKSNLMLSILPPGCDVVPWLGIMQQLGPKDEFPLKKIPNATVPTFPVKSNEKKSYASNATVWLSAQSLNADITKLLRHARKLPEKNTQFYKELNRMRKWAMTLGFSEIVETIALSLERECLANTSLTSEATIQLTHAASQLRLPSNFNMTIQPNKSARDRDGNSS